MWLTKTNSNNLDYLQNYWEDNFFKDFHFNSIEKIPKTDIIETDNEYQLKIQVPGLKKEDINIEIKNNILNINGEYKKEKKDFYKLESYSGKFSRSWDLKDIDTDKINAKLENGILNINLKKTKKNTAKKINIIS